MSPTVRTMFIVTLFAIALIQIAMGMARAQPQEPLTKCRLVTTCHIVPAEIQSCPPKNQQVRPCQSHVIAAHKVCSTTKICDQV